jgi:hypothetical protein
MSQPMDISMLETMLEGSAEALCHHLFPNGKVNGGYFQVGSLAGEPGKSLVINVAPMLHLGPLVEQSGNAKPGDSAEAAIAVWRARQP